MSRFYVSTMSERNKTRTHGGQKTLTVHVRGWNKGLQIAVFVNNEGLDTFAIYETGGSNEPYKTKILKTIVDKNSSGPRNTKGQLK